MHGGALTDSRSLPMPSVPCSQGHLGAGWSPVLAVSPPAVPPSARSLHSSRSSAFRRSPWSSLVSKYLLRAQGAEWSGQALLCTPLAAGTHWPWEERPEIEVVLGVRSPPAGVTRGQALWSRQHLGLRFLDLEVTQGMCQVAEPVCNGRCHPVSLSPRGWSEPSESTVAGLFGAEGLVLWAQHRPFSSE